MKHRIGILVFILAAVAVSCPLANAQEPVPVTKNYAAWAREFLGAMYPDLSGKKYFLSVEMWEHYDQAHESVRPLTVYVGEVVQYTPTCCFGGYAGMTPPPKHSDPAPKQLLRSGFAFDSRDRLESYGADGPGLGNRDAGLDLAELVDSHREWTDAEVVAALKKAGAKYGPDDKEQFMRDLPIQKLERFLGKLEIVSAEFTPLGESRNNVEIWPWWVVRARAKQSDGAVIGYKMRFEPYKGDLTDIWRVPNAFDPEIIK